MSSEKPIDVYLGLGSNMNNPRVQLEHAVEALAGHESIELVAVSSFYRNPPMDGMQQDDYINAVVRVRTRLSAEALLDQLQLIEAAQGRVRDEHWGPRTLDIDILLYGDEEIDTARLRIPHYAIHRRPFVLYPLAEINPDLVIPGRGPLSGLLDNCSPDGLEKITGNV